MKNTNLYTMIAVAIAAITIIGCNGDFGEGSSDVDGFLDRFSKNKKTTTMFSVTYDGNGKTSGEVPKDQNSPYRSGATVPVLDYGSMKKDGFDFDAWNDREDGKGDLTYTPGKTFIITKNIKFYAQWIDKSILTYNVTVTSSIEGTGASGGRSYVPGDTVTINAGTTPNGWRFQYWTTESGDGVNIADSTAMITTFIMPTNEVTVRANFIGLAGGTSSFNDSRDGKTYRTVKIGDQTWMAQNLNYQTSSGSWCYENNTDNCNTYGRLYDWDAAMTVCPLGWHLPTREEWGRLAKAAGGTGEYGEEGSTASTKLKAIDGGWDRSGGVNGTDDYGFSALPAGRRDTDGSFWRVDYIGYWWTEDAYYHRFIDRSGESNVVESNESNKETGFSVRCVQGNDGAGYAPELVAPSGLTATATAYSITLSWSPVRGATGYFVYRSTSPSDKYTSVGVTASTSYTDAGLTSGTAYYYKVSAYNRDGDESPLSSEFKTTTETITQIIGKFTDARNGKEYKTTTIDGKTWMAENLNYLPETGNSWCYDDDDSNCDTYGRLYDWATAMGLNTAFNSTSWGGSDIKRKGVCPAGYHLPSRQEWEDLETAVGGSSMAGIKLKATNGWDGNGDGTDDYGFSALPGGYRVTERNFSPFDHIGYHGRWWTATEGGNDFAFGRGMGYGFGDAAFEENRVKGYGYSVRCAKDN